MSEKSIVGDLINFRGLVYAPINENGVIFLFGKVVNDLNMYIEEIKPGYPDCIGRRFVDKGWVKVAIEFEYKSSNFKTHKHDPKGCDLIVCWEHDWKDCPLEVIELKTEIQALENYSISKPETDVSSGKNITIEDLFKNANSNNNVKIWYEKIYKKILEYNGNIWSKIGAKYSGWYSPLRAFVSVKPSSQSIKFECYSGKDAIDGSIITNKRFTPNWSRFTVKNDTDVDKAIKILIESHKRIENALSKGKTTCYYSGGESSPESAHRELPTPRSSPKSARREPPKPRSMPKSARRELPTPQSTPKSARRELPKPQSTPKSARRELPKPRSTPKSARREPPKPRSMPKSARRELPTPRSSPKSARRELPTPRSSPKSARREPPKPRSMPKSARRELPTPRSMPKLARLSRPKH